MLTGGQKSRFLCKLEDISPPCPALLIQDRRSNPTHSPDEEPVTQDDITQGVTRSRPAVYRAWPAARGDSHEH